MPQIWCSFRRNANCCGKESSGSSCEDDTELQALQEEQQRCARLVAKRAIKAKKRQEKEELRRQIRVLRSELDSPLQIPSVTPVPTINNGVVRGSDSTFKSSDLSVVSDPNQQIVPLERRIDDPSRDSSRNLLGMEVTDRVRERDSSYSSIIAQSKMAPVGKMEKG